MNPAEDAARLFASYPEMVRELATHARTLVLSVCPDAWERTYPKLELIRFGRSERMADLICHVGPLKDSVNIGFFQGTQLPDPDGLLVGSGKRIRHVKVRDVTALDQPALRTLLETAFGQPPASV